MSFLQQYSRLLEKYVFVWNFESYDLNAMWEINEKALNSTKAYAVDLGYNIDFEIMEKGIRGVDAMGEWCDHPILTENQILVLHSYFLKILEAEIKNNPALVRKTHFFQMLFEPIDTLIDNSIRAFAPYEITTESITKN